MAYTVNALSGFLQIGPHYFPERKGGVQVIMRGPHGQRLAADPVISREGRARGSGFRFWHEELNVPADVQWNPQQVVTGVMGLGAAAPDIQSIATCPPGARPLPKFPPANAPGSLAVREELLRAVGAACRGRIPGALKAIEGAHHFLKEVPSNWKGFWSSEIATATAYVAASRTGADVRRLEQERREDRHGQALVDYVKGFREPCGVTDVSCHLDRAGEWAKKNWWKIALGVGAVVTVYGGASGFGRGLAAKAL